MGTLPSKAKPPHIEQPKQMKMDVGVDVDCGKDGSDIGCEVVGHYGRFCD